MLCKITVDITILKTPNFLQLEVKNSNQFCFRLHALINKIKSHIYFEQIYFEQKQTNHF